MSPRGPSRTRLAWRPAAVAAALATGWACDASAGRPFVTDDAGVVGAGAFQVESWLRHEHERTSLWMVLAVGPIEPLELGAGAAVGIAPEDDWEPRIAGAALQAKLLGREADPAGVPGVACALGVLPPIADGVFVQSGWASYTYLAFTAVPHASERLTLHANLGAAFLAGDGAWKSAPVWGAAVEMRTWQPLAIMAEVFSADATGHPSAGAGQVGLIVSASESLQIDGTVGAVLWGRADPGAFGTLGVKWVADALW